MTLWFPMLVGAAAAQTAAQEFPWPDAASLEGVVRQEIADRWRVFPEDVVLEWGPASAGSPGGDALVTVAGGGRGGFWVAGFLPEASNVWIKVRVRAGVVERIPVAAHELARGALLRSEDVLLDERPRWGAPGDSPVPEELIGWRVARRINAGEALGPPAVRPEDAVRSGEIVELMWESPSVTVSVEANSMGTGVVGDTIWVRVHGNRRVRALIEGPGVARVLHHAYRGGA